MPVLWNVILIFTMLYTDDDTILNEDEDLMFVKKLFLYLGHLLFQYYIAQFIHTTLCYNLQKLNNTETVVIIWT